MIFMLCSNVQAAAWNTSRFWSLLTDYIGMNTLMPCFQKQTIQETYRQPATSHSGCKIKTLSVGKRQSDDPKRIKRQSVQDSFNLQETARCLGIFMNHANILSKFLQANRYCLQNPLLEVAKVNLLLSKKGDTRQSTHVSRWQWTSFPERSSKYICSYMSQGFSLKITRAQTQ